MSFYKWAVGAVLALIIGGSPFQYPEGDRHLILKILHIVGGHRIGVIYLNDARRNVETILPHPKSPLLSADRCQLGDPGS